MKKRLDWVHKAIKEWENSIPDIPPMEVIPVKQTPHEKKMAKLMQKMIDYEYAQIKASKILRTPWGVIMWTPTSPQSGKEKE